MILLYDGTLEGYFTALFLIFQEKEKITESNEPVPLYRISSSRPARSFPTRTPPTGFWRGSTRKYPGKH